MIIVRNTCFTVAISYYHDTKIREFADDFGLFFFSTTSYYCGRCLKIDQLLGSQDTWKKHCVCFEQVWHSFLIADTMSDIKVQAGKLFDCLYSSRNKQKCKRCHDIPLESGENDCEPNTESNGKRKTTFLVVGHFDGLLPHLLQIQRYRNQIDWLKNWPQCAYMNSTKWPKHKIKSVVESVIDEF